MKKKLVRPLPPALVLRCGCEVRFSDGEAPMCPTHGLSSVARTLRMPKPRFRGLASGPLVQSVDLGAWTGRLAGNPPKES